MISGEPLLLHKHTYTIRSIAFSPNGKLLATLSIVNDKTVVIWDTTTLLPVFQFYSGSGTTELRFSPDSTTLIGTGVSSELRFWDVQSGTERYITPFSPNASIRFISQESGYLITCNSHVLSYYDVWTQVLIKHRTLPPIYSNSHQHCGWVTKDARYIAIEDQDASIVLWDIDQEKIVRRFMGNISYVESVDFHEPDSSLVCLCDNGDIHIWDMQSGMLINNFHTSSPDVWSVQHHPKLPILMIAGLDDYIELWDTTSGTMRARLSGLGSELTAAFSLDGTLVVSGSDDTMIRIWKLD